MGVSNLRTNWDRFDHIVLTVRSLVATLSFYERVLKT